MGLPVAGDPVESCSKRFANDVLKIEISGPEERHLSFVDLPGLYHSGFDLSTTATPCAGILHPYRPDIGADG